MDLISDGASVIAEDRISNLPDDIIYHILSFMDMKYAIQTSTLSRKWKHVWTVMPQLNLNSDKFCSLRRFGKFVLDALSHRNSLTEVSAVKLKLKGSMTRPFVTDILNYALLRNLRQLTIRYSGTGTQHDLPQCLFVSHTLKHLTLVNPFSSSRSCTPNSPWDFPVLETLNLTFIRLGDGSEKNLDLFSKCVNLKDITLHWCSMKGVEVFNVCAPQLSNFTITEASILPKAVNLVAPQLETVTASASAAICSEGLSSCSIFLHLSIACSKALEKVNVSMSNSRLRKERHVPSLLDLFRILHSVKFLILDVYVIESLSSCLDQLAHEPCPFDNLKCLKISTKRDCIPTIPTQVRNYLLANSPNATFIMDLPQVPRKRSREEVDIDTVSKVAKLEAEEKRMLEAKAQRQDQLIAHQKTEIRMQDSFIAQHKAKLQMCDQIIAQHKSMLMAKIKRRARLVAKQKEMFEAKMQMQDQLVALQKAKMQIPVQSQVNGQPMEEIRTQDQLIAQHKAEIPVQSQVNGKLTGDTRMQDQLTAQQKAEIPVQSRVNGVLMAKIQKQDQHITQQKAEMPVQSQVNGQLMAKIQIQDQLIAQNNAEIPVHSRVNGVLMAKIRRQDQRTTQQKAEIPVQSQVNGQLIAKIQMQDQLIAQQKAELPVQSQVDGQLIAKIQMQDQLIAQQKAKLQENFQVNRHQVTKVRMLDQVIAQQKEKIQMNDQIIAQHKSLFRAEIKRRDQLVAKQKEMFEAKMQMQDKVITKLKGMLAAQNLQHEKLTTQIIKCKMAELKVQIENGNPDYEVICSVGHDIKSAMDLMPRRLRGNVEAQFSFQYEVLKSRFLTHIDAGQWVKIETELGNITLSERFHSDHSHSQSHNHAAELSAAPRVSTANWIH